MVADCHRRAISHPIGVDRHCGEGADLSSPTPPSSRWWIALADAHIRPHRPCDVPPFGARADRGADILFFNLIHLIYPLYISHSTSIHIHPSPISNFYFSRAKWIPMSPLISAMGTSLPAKEVSFRTYLRGTNFPGVANFLRETCSGGKLIIPNFGWETNYPSLGWGRPDSVPRMSPFFQRPPIVGCVGVGRPMNTSSSGDDVYCPMMCPSVFGTPATGESTIQPEPMFP